MRKQVRWQPGAPDASALRWTYAALPCAIKLAALVLLVACRRLLVDPSAAPGHAAVLGKSMP